MQAYEWHHIVTFEETNLVGNVYYANHIRWQGKCRELFLHDHAPDVLEELHQGLSMVTMRVTCEYYNELFAFDKVVIRMHAGAISANQITMLFDYVRRNAQGKEELIARGEQQIACLRKEEAGMLPTPIPVSFQEALKPYLSQGGE